VLKIEDSRKRTKEFSMGNHDFLIANITEQWFYSASLIMIENEG